MPVYPCGLRQMRSASRIRLGNVSTESVTFVIEGPALDLETKEMFVPYSAFNFKPSGGGHICYVAVRAEIFIDGLVVGILIGRPL